MEDWNWSNQPVLKDKRALAHSIFCRAYQLQYDLLNRGVLIHLGLVVRILTIADITTGIQ